MYIQTFSLECNDASSMTPEIDKLFIENKPSLVIGYGNADLPFSKLQHGLSAFTAPSFISSSCSGAPLCDGCTVDAGCQLAFVCVNADGGAYGIGSADTSCGSAFEAGAIALQNALNNAGRPKALD
jgi:hypothetical protein